jgi:hypothetical protein
MYRQRQDNSAPHQDSTIISAAEHAKPYASPEDRTAKSRESPIVEIFSEPRVTSVDHHYDRWPFGVRSRCLFRTVDFVHAESVASIP